MPKNKLKDILIKEGKSQAELVRVSGLSVATIANCYHQKGNPSIVTKSKVTNGINKLIGGEIYKIETIFPV